MKPSRSILTIALLTAVVAFGLAFIETSATASGSECGPCGGPQQTVVGSGNGNSCAQALDRARTNAVQQAHSGAPACSPCQISDGYATCYAPQSGIQWGASWTLHYRCQVCVPGDPEEPEL
ncbi:MAG: hypothetical protein MI919_33135 [Holophagales bacterium]|nr:hypothetical protein [Holophagales bacterium]